MCAAARTGTLPCNSCYRAPPSTPLPDTGPHPNPKSSPPLPYPPLQLQRQADAIVEQHERQQQQQQPDRLPQVDCEANAPRRRSYDIRTAGGKRDLLYHVLRLQDLVPPELHGKLRTDKGDWSTNQEVGYVGIKAHSLRGSVSPSFPPHLIL